MAKVKICGITNLEDAVLAVDLGADALGFNFYRGSSRYLSPAAARMIIDELPSRIKNVGVFVGAGHDEIMAARDVSRIDAVQLHGREGAFFVKGLAERTDAEIIYAFPAAADLDSSIIASYGVRSVLLDSFEDGQFGGSGRPFNWKLAASLTGIIDTLYLAGGLVPENVSEAVVHVRPEYVDVATGVEARKGKKDPNKLEAFIRNAKNA